MSPHSLMRSSIGSCTTAIGLISKADQCASISAQSHPLVDASPTHPSKSTSPLTHPAGMRRNRWPASRGITGRHRRNTQIERISHSILLLRGHRVILDRDLAAIYGVTTGRLNEAVKRNAERFPEDFMFRLTREEAERSRSQIAILKS